MTEIKKILAKYGYRISYKAYHKEADLKTYKNKRDHVSGEKHLTIITPSGHVAGRLFHARSTNGALTAEKLQKLINIFDQYIIPYSEKIKQELEKIGIH